MKKMILIAAIALASFVAVNAQSVDFMNSDGSAYRVTVDTDWAGRTTVSEEYVSSTQRTWEGVGAVVLLVLFSLL